MNSVPPCTTYAQKVLQPCLPEKNRALQPLNKSVTPTKWYAKQKMEEERGIETKNGETKENGEIRKEKGEPLLTSSRPATPSKIRRSPSKLTDHSPSKLESARTPIKDKVSSSSFAASTFASSFSHANDSLHRQYAEVLAKLSSISADYKHLEEELAKKLCRVSELTQKMMYLEKVLRSMEEDRRKAREMLDHEVAFYKESLDELQRMNLKISLKLEANQKSAEARFQETETKYMTLLRSYKALQSNLELEQNLKALLIDQIEYLTKERDFLLQNANPQVEGTELDGSLDLNMDILNNSDFGNPEFDASDFDSGSNSDGSVRGTGLMSFRDLKADDFESSSPIKAQTICQKAPEQLVSPTDSFEASRNYQFPSVRDLSLPPLHEQNAKAKKRQSLPAKLRTEETEFVLSPMKLASQANLSYFEEHPTTDSVTKRHSISTSRRYSRASHSRFNSHDIVPIKVEFESDNIRALSASAKLSLTELASVAESHIPLKDSCDEAFMRLNGYSRVFQGDSNTASSSKRSSVISKRSSVWSDANLLSGDVTKQEITKLKFELQSLKLHNEKLLSYIGFELQKQKKNIKKLSSKQNLRPKDIEYSDAKLIERLKDMLIHKKRVLRSVSINPTFSRGKLLLENGVGLGPNEDEDFSFKSHFINSIHEKEAKGDYSLLELLVKKYKSQTFRAPNTQYFFSDDSEVEEFDMDIDGAQRDGEWDTSSDGSVVLEVNFNSLNRFNQMRYMIFGKEHLQKEKATETIADENLKYKFLTIALGIIVVAVQVTSSAQHHSK